MGVWSTCEDIDTFLYRYSDSPAREMSEDDIANTLLGIKTLHEQRCQRLWDAFEQVLANNATTKPEGLSLFLTINNASILWGLKVFVLVRNETTIFNKGNAGVAEEAF